MARIALLLPLLVALLLPAAASASLSYGMGDEDASMFASPAFRQLPIQRVRYVVAYDAALTRNFERQQADAFLRQAHALGYDVLVAFEHSREPHRAQELPSTADYQRGVRAFMRRYPYVRTYSAWDEINSCSQPTCRSPKAAARYFLTMRRTCPQCTVIAGEVLDTTDPSATVAYLREYERYAAPGHPAIWGLHNYSDVNRFTSRGTRAVLGAVPGTVWLTETGGLYSFGRDFPPSASRQARAERHMLSLARSSSRITRLYVYSWTGGGLFDAGLMSVGGSPRPAFAVVRRALG